MKILIIEDQWGIINFLKEGLSEEGYLVDYAQNSDEAEEKFSKQSYDLILLDWMLPKVSGLEICKRIRINNKNIPIIFLTAKDTLQDTIEGLSAGANDYIKKPFQFSELLVRIQVQLRYKNTEKEIIIYNNIVIDPNSQSIKLNNALISFTLKEYLLLEYLIKNKGRICTRKEILEKIWNIYFDYDSSVIDVFINAIRKKLNLNKETNFIKTIRGTGYIVE